MKRSQVVELVRRVGIAFGVAAASIAPAQAAVPPLGDTQGIVAAVRIRPAAGSVNSFEVWFSPTHNDRWSCLGGGPIIVYENGIGVTPASYKQLFAIALLAQQTGKVLALDSSGTNPCSNVNTAWIVGP